ncbi:hypothetical protein Tco_0377672 [Tanacetum coccineum]
MGMYISSQSSCDFTTVTIIGETEERRITEGIIRNYYDREDGETTPRFEAYNYGVLGECKRRAFWSLNEDILKITILKTNTPYPSRRYGVSVPALTKDHRRLKTNTPYPKDSICRIQDME